MKSGALARVGPLAAAVLLLLSCSPLVRMKVAVVLPAGIEPDPTRLRVTVASSCDPVGSGDRKAAPPPAPAPGAAGQGGATLEGGRLVFEASERSFRCFFHLAAGTTPTATARSTPGTRWGGCRERWRRPTRGSARAT